jgi:hypothetical protein
VELVASPAAAARLVAARAAAALLSQLPAGWVFSQLGSQGSLGAAATVEALAALAGAWFVRRRQLGALTAAACAGGFAQAVWATSRRAYMRAAVPPEMRGRLVGVPPRDSRS